MSVTLRIGLIAVSLILFGAVWLMVARRRMAMKYALLWLAFSFVLIVISVLPRIVTLLSGAFGFEVSSNFLFLIIIGLLILICISFSMSVTTLNRKLNAFVQISALIGLSAEPGYEKRSDTLVVIPAYNESMNILGAIRDLTENAPSTDYIIVNDGSKDNTAEICAQNGLRHINLPVNLGIGGAVQTGYKYAKRYGYDICVQFDGDGQHNACYIGGLIDEIRHGADFVAGSRFIKKQGFQSSSMRRAGIKAISALLLIIFRRRATDPTSGLRACGKALIDVFAENYPTDYPEPESLAFVFKKKYAYRELPVVMNDRAGGVSSIRALKSVYYMIKVTFAILNVLIQK